MLTPAERAEIQQAIGGLLELCDRTPEREAKFEAATLVVITKMLYARPSSQQSEVGIEAIGESYQIALDDVPTWAVIAAVRKWYRGECGMRERGEPYDYRWRPAPAELRRLAIVERAPLLERIHVLQKLLKVEPLSEFSEQHEAHMRARYAELSASLKSA